MVANTDLEKKSGTHWWSFLDIDAKDTLFFFDSFGSFGLLNFIVEMTCMFLIKSYLENSMKFSNKTRK